MNNWLIQHIRVLLFTLRRLRVTPLSSLLNILVIGIALSLPAGLYVLLQNVQSLAEQAVGKPQISVFLSMNASQDDIARIGKQLRQHDAIGEIEFVPRDQALEQLKQTTGLADVIGGLAQNPLPDAYIVYPKNPGAQVLEALRGELQKWPQIEHVQLDSDWAHKLEALLKFGRLAVLILAVLLSFALVAVTFNTIRLQILTQRDEIEVSALIGATHAFIRRPFLYFGLLQGLLGGGLWRGSSSRLASPCSTAAWPGWYNCMPAALPCTPRLPATASPCCCFPPTSAGSGHGCRWPQHLWQIEPR